MKINTKWVVKNQIEGDFSIEKLFKAILQNRNIENVKDFLNPDISKIPSFENLHDSKTAAEKIVNAVKEKKKIVIYGDYDVDGISGTCLLWSFLYFELSEFLNLQKEDLNILPYIPDRVDEGYGLSVESLEKLKEQGVDLLITVDCGVRDKELIKKYKDIEFIVTDHHLPPDDILENLDYPLVHQLYPGNEYPFPSVCGAFVAFLLLLAIKENVGMESSFEKNTQYLDLVALPTVTDIMPLHGVNRIVVKHGLETIRKGERLGLSKLSETAKIELENISTYHLGYLLGPRLNASGRIGSAMDGLKLLSTKNASQAKELANKLDSLNFERQKLTSEILKQAREKILSEDLKSLIFVIGEGWNEGIIGLVASKLQEEFYRPVIIVTKNEGEIKGSARSINGLNITEVIETFSEFLIKFGGHAQAAGFSVKEGSLDEFREKIVEYVQDNLGKELLDKTIDIDVVLNTKDLNMELAENLLKLEPFGYGNKKPLFLLEKVVVVNKKVLGKDQNHMKLEIKGEGSGVEEAIMFNCLDDIEKIKVDDVIDLVGCVGINEWNNLTKVQFEVKDWRACNDSQ
jgi:single-stranded-DNA-specific exonuclease